MWRQYDEGMHFMRLYNGTVNSGAVIAKIPLRSPQKLVSFIIKEIICWVKVSKNKTIKF